jgi:hypothetical protein
MKKGKKEAKVELTVGQKKSAQLMKYRDKYVRYDRGGMASLDNGDAIAQLLRGADISNILRAADRLTGKEDGYHASRYAARNHGAKRMNAGNVIRGAARRDELTLAQVKDALK